MDQSLSYASENERFALAYLERYGEMIQAQENEDEATIAHVRPIFHTIQRLGGGSVLHQGHSHSLSTRTGSTTAHKNAYTHTNTQHHVSVIKDTSFTADADDTYMQHSMHTSTRHGHEHGSESLLSTPPASVATSVSYDDKLEFETMRRFKDDPLILSIDDSKDYEVLKTDQQLCLVLKTIAEACDYRQEMMERDGRGHEHQHGHSDKDAGITFAEFVHVYKIAVSGMQALQMLPNQGKDFGSDMDRKRTWGRCLVMLRLFSRVNVGQIEAADDSNASIISVEQEDENEHNNERKGDLHRPGEENDSRTEKEVQLLKGEARSHGNKEDTISGHIEIVREREAAIARLMEEVSAGNRKSNLLLRTVLFLLAALAGLGYQYQQQHQGISFHETVVMANKIEETSVVNSTAVSAPVRTESETDSLVGELVLSLADTKDQLNEATTQVGSLVLDMTKVNKQLASCLNSGTGSSTIPQTAAAAVEDPPEMITPSESNIDDSRSRSRSRTDNGSNKVKQNEPTDGTGSSTGTPTNIVRRQIATAIGTAAIMIIPSFLPVSLLQKFAAILARIIR